LPIFPKQPDFSPPSSDCADCAELQGCDGPITTRRGLLPARAGSGRAVAAGQHCAIGENRPFVYCVSAPGRSRERSPPCRRRRPRGPWSSNSPYGVEIAMRSSWFRRRQQERPTPRPRAFRPALEGLEDRTLLSAPAINPISGITVPQGKPVVVPVTA